MSEKETARSIHGNNTPNKVTCPPEIIDKRIEYGHSEADSVIYSFTNTKRIIKVMLEFFDVTDKFK